MQVAMTNCGRFGWVSDRRGYRYEGHDPQTGLPWPALPEAFLQLANAAAAAAGFANYRPGCLPDQSLCGGHPSVPASGS
ncbi:MAG: alpha-ketoglutarate-dependent dioxygenase AlkB [Lysobacterales bacterium]